MPDQLDEEPLVIIRGLLDSRWDTANTEYSSDPRFTTGWWDWDREEPVVTITNSEVNPVTGGNQQGTGYTYMTGDGRAGQQYNGYCLVNCWGGTFETATLSDEGPNGGRLSPKVMAWQMCKEAKRVLRTQAEGTTADDGSLELTHVAPGAHRRIVEADEDDEHPALFRYEIECRFGYFEES